jgi:hypothetical protein
VSLAWENPLLNWDIGDLDIRLRCNDVQEPVLDWLQDSCYQEGGCYRADYDAGFSL